MSTILKALRRVEEERPRTPSAPRRAMRGDFVGGPGDAPPPRRKRREPNWKVWGSLGAVLLLAALVWWRLPRPAGVEIVAAEPPPRADQVTPQAPAAAVPRPAPQTRAEAPAAPPPTPPAERLAQATQPAPEPAAAPAPAPAVPAAAPTAMTSDVPAEVAQRLPPLGATLEPPAPAAATPREPQPAAPAPQAAASPPAPRPAAPRPALKPAPTPEPQLAAREPETPPRPAPVAATAPREPAAPQPSAPSVLIERTSWHPKPERRVAWVRVEGLSDPRELHEGDAVGTLVVKEIRPSSVLFQHGSEQLQRRVGER